VLTRFRTAYVSGPYGDGAELPDALLAGPSEVRPFPASVLPAPRHMAVRAAVPAAEDDPTRPTVLSVMVEQIAAGGGQAHQVWLPPLEAPEPLDVLMGGLAEHPGRGLGEPGPELCVPIGTVDLPFQQRREPFVVDVSAAGGHIGIIGRPRSGKSPAHDGFRCALPMLLLRPLLLLQQRLADLLELAAVGLVDLGEMQVEFVEGADDA